MPQTKRHHFFLGLPTEWLSLWPWITVNYRESYDMFAVSGILFNQESPRRGLEFVTRKISNGVARIKLVSKNTIELGNLVAKRDWVMIMIMSETCIMIKQTKAVDYVIAMAKLIVFKSS
jgi:GDPmannose 4,6-dehydratase